MEFSFDSAWKVKVLKKVEKKEGLSFQNIQCFNVLHNKSEVSKQMLSFRVSSQSLFVEEISVN